jgi:hypothetical protein
MPIANGAPQVKTFPVYERKITPPDSRWASRLRGIYGGELGLRKYQVIKLKIPTPHTTIKPLALASGHAR